MGFGRLGVEIIRRRIDSFDSLIIHHFSRIWTAKGCECEFSPSLSFSCRFRAVLLTVSVPVIPYQHWHLKTLSLSIPRISNYWEWPDSISIFTSTSHEFPVLVDCVCDSLNGAVGTTSQRVNTRRWSFFVSCCVACCAEWWRKFTDWNALICCCSRISRNMSCFG